jgi:hypothetical protein
MQTLALWILSILVGGFIGYMTGYMKKKGEDRATREGFKDVLAELKETTHATKQIETMILDKAWGRQKQWEMKRDALVAALQALEFANDALMKLALEYESKPANGAEEDATRQQTRWEKTLAWQRAIEDLDDKRVIVNLVCSKAIIDALRTAARGMRLNASKPFKSVIRSYDEMGAETQKHISEAFRVARTELGVESE